AWTLRRAPENHLGPGPASTQVSSLRTLSTRQNFGFGNQFEMESLGLPALEFPDWGMPMALGLATATLVGAVLGWGNRISAVIVVLPLLVIGGMASGLSIIQIASSVLMLQVGYIVCSFLRISRMKRQIGSDATRTGNKRRRPA